MRKGPIHTDRALFFLSGFAGNPVAAGKPRGVASPHTQHVTPRRAVASFTANGIAYDRAGPRGELPIVLVHAGVADRRMWESQWPALAGLQDVVRVDLRGFGGSTKRPDHPFSQPEDVLNALAEIGVDRCHLVGASFGAGVAAEISLIQPSAVASLLLAAPAG